MRDPTQQAQQQTTKKLVRAEIKEIFHNSWEHRGDQISEEIPVDPLSC